MLNIHKDRIYISATYSERHKYHKLFSLLEAAPNIEPVGYWLFTDDDANSEEAAIRDFSELLSCNRILVLNDNGYNSGGKCCEMGMALAKNMHVDVVGPQTHIFHHLPQVSMWDSLDEWTKENVLSYERIF